MTRPPNVTMRVTGLNELDRALKDLVPQIRGKKGFAQNPLRTATRKGADVIVEAAKRKAQLFDDPDTPLKVYQNIGRKPISTKERDAVTARGDSLEGYDIGVTKQAWHAIFQELGTDKQAARPFLRPAIAEKREAAIGALTSSLRKSLNAIVKKLARRARVRP